MNKTRCRTSSTEMRPKLVILSHKGKNHLVPLVTVVFKEFGYTDNKQL